MSININDDEARVQASLGTLPKTKVEVFYVISQDSEEIKNPDIPLKRLKDKINTWVSSEHGKTIIDTTSISVGIYTDLKIIATAMITYHEI